MVPRKRARYLPERPVGRTDRGIATAVGVRGVVGEARIHQIRPGIDLISRSETFWINSISATDAEFGGSFD